jgi:hypothetical protein
VAELKPSLSSIKANGHSTPIPAHGLGAKKACRIGVATVSDEPVSETWEIAMAAPSDNPRAGAGSVAPWLVGLAEGGVAAWELPSSVAGTSEPVGGMATGGGKVGDGSGDGSADGVSAPGSDKRADASGTAGRESGAAGGWA